jgi:hypothetical protein
VPFDERTERQEFETALREAVEALVVVGEAWEQVESASVKPGLHEHRPEVTVSIRILGKPKRTYVAPCGLGNLSTLGAAGSASVALTNIEEELRSLALGASDESVWLTVVPD